MWVSISSPGWGPVNLSHLFTRHPSNIDCSFFRRERWTLDNSGAIFALDLCPSIGASILTAVIRSRASSFEWETCERLVPKE